MAQKYKQRKADFLFLYEIVELDDMVAIDSNMSEFMANPTKKFASELYERCITLWFHQERGNTHCDEVHDIGVRHGETL